MANSNLIDNNKTITPASLLGSYYIPSHSNYLAYSFHLKIPTFIRMVKLATSWQILD